MLCQIIFDIRFREELNPRMRELVAKDYRAALVHVSHISSSHHHHQSVFTPVF